LPETFAVWLRPRSSCGRAISGWPALRKLEYVDELLNASAAAADQMIREKIDPLSHAYANARRHYRKKTCSLRLRYAATYYRDLLRLFSRDLRHHRRSGVAVHLAPRATIRSWWRNGPAQYQLRSDVLLDEIMQRCLELDLARRRLRRRKLMDGFHFLLTAKTMHALFAPSRRRWLALLTLRVPCADHPDLIPRSRASAIPSSISTF